MSMLAEYQRARAGETVARLRRVLALRAMLATGASQREIASELGITQPAVSQQLKTGVAVDLETLIDAATPILKALAAERGFTDLALFGSVARGQSRMDSDVDLLVRPPQGATISDLVDLRELFERVLDRPVDLVTYGGLKAGIDDVIFRDSVAL
ncbi:nucleotidyltransferase domain-containing protein [Humibacillus sp. DSM 29435]|uniref:nucleotidyltransferase domain-containing protein n=1 Tax=Humibacillus sp. DSM 29435 TaxID=1869167 RepID=UPI0009F69F72|nr:nucleotidyltransferase domain-containing protein [Humibacillus sp. DSM 29435]